MFNHLVESESHAAEFKRKGRFFLVTLVGYSILFLFAGVASIYAYDANLENQNLEFITLLSPVEPQVEAPPSNANQNPNPGGQRSDNGVRIQLIDRVDNSSLIPDQVSSQASPFRPIPPGNVRVGDYEADFNAGGGGPATPGGGGNGNSDNRSTQVVQIDPPPVAPPVQPPRTIRATSVLNSQATSLPRPEYPVLAKKTGVSGPVAVQILIDEQGRVIAAKATSGHPLLRAASERAAYLARFTPTKVSNIPVKVSGIITYNFVLQ
jgi:protein TonB